MDMKHTVILLCSAALILSGCSSFPRRQRTASPRKTWELIESLSLGMSESALIAAAARHGVPLDIEEMRPRGGSEEDTIRTFEVILGETWWVQFHTSEEGRLERITIESFRNNAATIFGRDWKSEVIVPNGHVDPIIPRWSEEGRAHNNQLDDTHQ